MSLPVRLIATIGFVLAAILLCGGALSYWQALRRVDIETNAALAHGKSTVLAALDDAARSADPRRELVHLMRAFDGSRHVRAFLVAEDGRIETSTVQPPANGVPDWFCGLLAEPLVTALVELPGSFAPYIALRLQTEARGEIDEVWGEVRLDALILAVLFTLVLATVYVTLRRVLSPLPILARAFKRIGDGDYAPQVAETGPPEFETLCRGFNEMAVRLAEMERRNRALNEQLAAVQEEERAEIARDLHDDIGPLIFAIDVDAMTIEEISEAGGGPRIGERARAIRASAASMKDRVRGLLGLLRPAVLLDLGLSHAVEQLVGSHRRRHPETEFALDLPEGGWGSRIDGALYHVIRESIGNGLRHGKPSRIEVAAGQRADGSIVLTVSDNGGGIAPGRRPAGFGLLGMRERVAALGGAFEVDAGSGQRGVTIVTRIPASAGHTVRKAIPA